jgi:signal transduction histidine kinase
VRVLLIEDDEDDFVLTRGLLAEAGAERYELDWVSSYELGLEQLARREHDVCLLDYRLGAHSGLELLTEACAQDCIPIILLTGLGDRELDLQAMAAGAADYLTKSELNAALLERAIRYAIAQRRSEQERLQLALAREAQAQAERANRAKDDFLALVSHELRSPLNAMLGWVQVLRQTEVTPDVQEKALETIERSARTQARMIEDLLDISRIVNGRLQLNKEPVEIATVVRAAADLMRPAAEAKQITLATELDPAVSLVAGDADRLQQIVVNLLSNAIKFTSEGGRVTVRLETNAARLRLSVTDTGKGISGDFLPHIFDRFSQAENGALRSRQGGLGLGLAIVRHLVELHGGTIHAESPGPEQGANFIIELPALPQ